MCLRAADPDVKSSADAVIFLHLQGGPSHLDLFDPKPQLVKMNGKPMPESLTRGQRIAQLMGQPLNCVGSRFRFDRHGQSGMEISELLPHIGSIADDIAMVRSMHTEAINHDPAITYIATGAQQPGRAANRDCSLTAVGVRALRAHSVVTAPELSSTAEASSNVSAQRSRQCSQEARRYADRNMRRTTATGAAGGAAIGAIASQSRRNTGRNAGRGALIGGGAGLLASTSRWQVYYNYSYRNCVRRR